MAYVLGKNEHWDLEKLQFEIIDHLEGAVSALTQKKADFFMWERFTTKPLVDKGIFRRLADCPTPWPCFVIAATNKFTSEQAGILEHILEVINGYTAEFKTIPCIDRTLANAYEQKLEDIKDWMSITQWSQSKLSEETLETVQNTLLDLNLITKKLSPEALRI